MQNREPLVLALPGDHHGLDCIEECQHNQVRDPNAFCRLKKRQGEKTGEKEKQGASGKKGHIQRGGGNLVIAGDGLAESHDTGITKGTDPCQKVFLFHQFPGGEGKHGGQIVPAIFLIPLQEKQHG